MDKLDGIEIKLAKLDLERLAKRDLLNEENLSRLGETPPPLPSKDGHDRPASPASSSSSADTARVATPPPLIIPLEISNRLDDMSTLLGTVLGQQKDILDELGRRQQPVVEAGSSRHVTLPHIQDLLHRILDRVGEAEYEYIPGKPQPYAPRKRSAAASDIDEEGPFYPGGGSVYSEEGHRVLVPPNTEASRASTVRATESLLNGDLPGPDFDEEMEMMHLPPDSPPHEQYIPRALRAQHLHGPEPLIRGEPLLQDYASEHGDDPIDRRAADLGNVLMPESYRARVDDHVDETRQDGSITPDGPLRVPRKGPRPEPVHMGTPVYDRKSLTEPISDSHNVPPEDSTAGPARGGRHGLGSRVGSGSMFGRVKAAPPMSAGSIRSRWGNRSRPVSST